MRYCGCSVIVLLLAAAVPRAPAQQMVDYSAVTEPYLLLVREPAVHEDLGLTDAQSAALDEFNAKLDPDLLALRNQSAERAKPKLRKVEEQTREYLTRAFSAKQRTRLEQIELRVRGLPCLILPRVAEELKLSDEQQRSIETALRELREEMGKLRRRRQQGEDVAGLEKEAARLREKQQEEIMEALTRDQQTQLAGLLGRSFDASRLGRLRFKAPELVQGPWINSKPLRLPDLRGKVVALHFYAFG